eukprot:5369586-Amphidinium_carterae.1
MEQLLQCTDTTLGKKLARHWAPQPQAFAKHGFAKTPIGRFYHTHTHPQMQVSQHVLAEMRRMMQITERSISSKTCVW